MQPDSQDNQQQNPTTTPVVTPVQTAPVPPVEPQPAPKKPKRNKRKLLLLLLLPLLILLGGSAAAYFGVYLPNTSENILKQALKNTNEQKTASYKGVLNYQDTKENGTVARVDFSGQSDSNTGNLQGAIDVTVSGVKLPFEIRKVDKSAYVKVGDLASLKGIATLAAPELSATIDELNKKLANQWLEIDETLLKQAKVDCTLNLASSTLTKQDLDLLINQYQKNKFATIKSSSSEKVNDSDAYKYEIDLDDNKLAEYVKTVGDVSILKKIKECSGNNDPINTKDLADNDVTPITLWVDKKTKLITQVASRSTKQDEEKEKFKSDIQVGIQYNQVQITKPENPRPLLEVISELGPVYESLLGGALGSGTDPVTSIDDMEL